MGVCRRSDEAFEEGGEAVEAAFEVGAGDGFFGFGLVSGEDGPAGGAHPVFLSDGFCVAAVADAGLAAEEVSDLDGGHERGVFTGFFGLVMPANGFDEDGREAMLLEVDGA